MNSSHAVPASQRTHIISAAGRIRNEHFILTAGHLMLETEPGSLDLICAFVEGGVQVRMLGAPDGQEYIVLAERGVYQVQRRRLVLTGWKGVIEGGQFQAATSAAQEVLLPVDGTFFDTQKGPPETEESRREDFLFQAA